MFIEFKPKRPSVFTPNFWPSEAATKAADKGYEAYCAQYYSDLGRCTSTDEMDRHRARMHAESMGIYSGMYTQVISLQSHIETQERQA